MAGFLERLVNFYIGSSLVIIIRLGRPKIQGLSETPDITGGLLRCAWTPPWGRLFLTLVSKIIGEATVHYCFIRYHSGSSYRIICVVRSYRDHNGTVDSNRKASVAAAKHDEANN